MSQLLLALSIVSFTDPPTAPAPRPVKQFRIVETRTGMELSLPRLADDLASRDIIYFGELHDNVAGHRVYADLAALLADRRPDLVISMEMFERDVQGVVTDYLRGRIDEATFLKYSRPWKNYARDYRPLIELARDRKLDVIAGNLPRPVAGKVASKEGSTSPFLPRKSTAPLDRYWDLFTESMKGHIGADEGMARMYRAQCAKDDAMAEGIADYLAVHPHRKPLVVHCTGDFHCDYGLGTAARLAQRVPLAQAAIISMVALPDISKADLTEDCKKAHYLLVVPTPPKPAKPPGKSG
ncbi:MAG TPA: ChaN family lipoprotein [Fimbriiglobus sp.]